MAKACQKVGELMSPTPTPEGALLELECFEEDLQDKGANVSDAECYEDVITHARLTVNLWQAINFEDSLHGYPSKPWLTKPSHLCTPREIAARGFEHQVKCAQEILAKHDLHGTPLWAS
jgi:hypothetical protein